MRRASSVTTSFIAACTLALAAIVGVSLSAQAGGNAEAAKMKNPVPVNAASIAAGKASYTKYCQFCHGETGKGDGKMAPKDSHPSDLTDAKWDHGSTDGEIFAAIQNGPAPNSVMKGFKARMTDEQIWQVVDYVRSIGPQKK